MKTTKHTPSADGQEFTDMEVKLIWKEISRRSWSPGMFYSEFSKANPGFCQSKDTIEKLISRSANRRIKAHGYHRVALAKQFAWTNEEFSSYLKTGNPPDSSFAETESLASTRELNEAIGAFKEVDWEVNPSTGKRSSRPREDRSDLAEQICYQEEYKKWRPNGKQLTEIADFLGERYGVKNKLFQFGSIRFPLATIWETTEKLNPNSILKPTVDRKKTYVIPPEERAFVAEHDTGPFKGVDALEFRMVAIEPKQDRIMITGGLGKWYDHVVSQVSLDWELAKAYLTGLPLSSPEALPRRQAFEETDPAMSIWKGTRRCACMATLTLMVVKSGSKEYRCYLPKRSDTVAQAANLWHVAPTGMFECSSSFVEDDWSITRNVERELLEEFLAVEEAQRQTKILGEQEPSETELKLNQLIKAKQIQHFMLGVCIHLTTLVPDLLTIFLIDKKDLLSFRDAKLNWEFAKNEEHSRRLNSKEINAFLKEHGSNVVSSGALAIKLGVKWLEAQGYL